VWRLRIYQDSKYPHLIESCKAAITEITGRRAGIMRRVGCHEISSYWKHWPCVFPQVAPGEKHFRRIELEAWQWRTVERHPKEFVKGLIHSDGCRTTNRVRNRLGKGYEYPRYFFTNHSDDIRGIFVRACQLIDVECRPNGPFSISVARRRSVDILDGFIGPKR
jgi:hypothetical protein